MSDNAAQDIRDFLTSSAVTLSEVLTPPNQFIPPGSDIDVEAIVRD